MLFNAELSCRAAPGHTTTCCKDDRIVFYEDRGQLQREVI